MIRMGLIAVVCLLSLCPVQAGQEIPFPELWNLVKKASPAIQSSQAQLKSAEIAESRSANHWFPRLALDARAYETNDPARSFMSLLEERQIAPADFSPAALNEPLDKFYESGTLGLDFPLFEGGGKEALADSARKMKEAIQWQDDSVQTQEYVKLAAKYADLLVTQDEEGAVTALQTQVQAVLDHYTIGSKSNPVGYSGLLGLKNLQNRLSGLSVQDQAQENTLKGQIGIEAPGLATDWAPVSLADEAFLDQAFPSSPAEEPAYVKAALSHAEAAEKMEGAQNALLLPRVALFGQGSVQNGDRATGTSYTAGAYLQWDLLDVPNFGAGDQAQADAKASREEAEVLRQKSAADRVQAVESKKALESNLALMEDSSKLLEEQTETARNLFKEGSINALQLVEVLSRRADLITSRAQAEMELVQARVQLAVNSGFQEPSNEK